MLNSIFRGIFSYADTQVISIQNFLLCVGTALIIGLMLAFSYRYKNRSTKSFVMTLAILPIVVCVVIMMVNGNLGAGVAVAGAFSLVRFRSAPGTAKEISAIFIAMGAGLAVGMGYLAYAVLFTLILCLLFIFYTYINFGESKNSADRTMRITIPENLDYTGVFDDLFDEYTTECQVINVKTTNLGSLFRLTYNLTLKDISKEKEFIDKLRCRNGNLEISVSIQENGIYEL